jgi:hypothetical protein
MHYHIAETTLYEIGLSKELPQISANGPQFQRLEVLYACLQACKSFFDTFFSIPVSNYFLFSMPTWSNLSYCMIILQALSDFNHPDWNLESVRETLDFRDVLDRIIERFEKVESEPGCEGTTAFSRTAKRIRSIQKILKTKAVDLSKDRGLEAQDVRDPEILNTADFTDLFDEAWLRDILGSWESQPNMGMM